MKLLAGFPLIGKDKVPRQVISDSWDQRGDILEPGVNLFCWKRPVDKAIDIYLESITQSDKEPIILFTHLKDLTQNLSKARLIWDPDHLESGDLFWRDVEGLSHDFLHFSEANSGTIHLKVIKDDACTKFHVDGYSLRLFTTYYGRGTEWLPEHATNRKGLGKSNEMIVKDRSQVQQMDPFEVGILKGELTRRLGRTRGIVHRSPELSESGGRRIILRIDL